MHPFDYHRAGKLDEASNLRQGAGTEFIAGGTTLLDLMKLNVSTPRMLIDINQLGLNKIEKRGKSLFIGALVSNTDLAQNKLIQEDYPVLSEAILAGASVQLRNMASVGGNIMQRTRCYYFRDPAMPCNKREPGSGCPAIEGFNRMHAVLGGSDNCIATHGSDMCVALVALDAVVHLEGPKGKRSVLLEEFHLLPGDTPHLESVLQQGEIITELEIPDRPFAKHSYYLKVRDRASYAFSLCSVAVALELNGETIKSCRVAFGGVATKPWRSKEAEKILTGRNASKELFQRAADAAVVGALGQKYNKFKIDLTKRTLVRALTNAGALV